MQNLMWGHELKKKPAYRTNGLGCGGSARGQGSSGFLQKLYCVSFRAKDICFFNKVDNRSPKVRSLLTVKSHMAAKYGGARL